MPKVKPVNQDVFEQIKPPPLVRNISRPVLESSVQESQIQKAKIEQAAAEDKAKSEQQAKQIVQQLEAEMDKWRQIRVQQMAERRKEPEQPAEPSVPTELPQMSSKPKRGLFGAGRRVKSAQDQSQPETAGKRVGG